MPTSPTSPNNLPLALTMGDPAGVGPDITLKAWRERRSSDVPAFVVIGDPDTFRARAKLLGIDVPVEEIDEPGAATDRFIHALPVYPLPLRLPASAGVPDPSSATAIVGAIGTATDWVLKGQAEAVVTNPINKNLLSQSGFNHPGHTEYLAELCSVDGKPPRVVMLLTSGALRVVPVTIHMPLKDVPRALNRELIIETTEITARALRNLFDIAEPRIAMTGLNPHAGEEGTMGREEIEIIAPAIEELKSRGFDVSGPLPADGVYQERVRSIFDAVIAMYHDQALIPVKALAFDSTVNVTLGLPIIRTSPDHGTAYALAGTGKAHPGSLIESLRLARTLATRRLAVT